MNISCYFIVFSVEEYGHVPLTGLFLVVPKLHIQATQQTFYLDSLELRAQISEVLASFQSCPRNAGRCIREAQIFFLPLSGPKYFKLNKLDTTMLQH